MIGRLLSDLSGRVSAADAVATADDTISVSCDADGATVAAAESHQVQVRVVDRGRVGWAGGEGAFAAEVVAGALRSAEVGATGSLYLPAPSPLSPVVTRSPATGALGPRDLVGQARDLEARLRRRGWLVEAFAERSVGVVAIGNTRGVTAEYPTTLLGLGATVSTPDGRLSFRAHQSQVAPMGDAEIDALVREFEDVLAPAPVAAGSLPRRIRVWFAPRSVRAILGPLLSQLTGETWLAGRTRWPALDERVSVVDDPLLPGRPGSRPIDDDGVPARRLTLIDRGRATAGVLDVATGSRHLLPPTGHGWRRGPTPPRIGFSNVLMEQGTASDTELAVAAEDGLLVRDLRIGPAPNPETGVFRMAAPWTYLLAKGEIVGRVEDVVLSGNVFELLGPGRLVAVGVGARWIGAASVPPLVADGVGVTLR